jgi:hypothetical protein
MTDEQLQALEEGACPPGLDESEVVPALLREVRRLQSEIRAAGRLRLLDCFEVFEDLDPEGARPGTRSVGVVRTRNQAEVLARGRPAAVVHKVTLVCVGDEGGYELRQPVRIVRIHETARDAIKADTLVRLTKEQLDVVGDSGGGVGR